MRWLTAGGVALAMAAPASSQNQSLVGGMSLAELRECAALAREIAAAEAAIAATDRGLAATGQAIRAESDAIDRSRRTVDVRNAKAVAAFNARLAALNGRTKAYATAAARRGPAAAAFNDRIARDNILCANRNYDPALLTQLPAADAASLERRARTVVVPRIPAAPTTGIAVGEAAPPVPPAADTLAGTRAAAEKGEAAAQLRLGQQLRRSDPATGLAWIEKAAAQDDAAALFELSHMYEFGDGAPMDRDRAQRYLERAAAAGSADGQHNLALWYNRRNEGNKDAAAALDWMGKAAAQGDPESQFVLAEMLRRATGGRRDPDAALEWMRKSAAQGFRAAQVDLGERAERGNGVARDPVEALKWYSLAAATTRADAAQDCLRRTFEEATVRRRAGEAATRLKASLPPADADRALRLVADWRPTSSAVRVGGCPTLGQSSARAVQ